MKVCVIGYGNMGRNHKRVLESMGHEVTTLDNDPQSGADLIFGELEMRIGRMAFDAFCVAAPISCLRDAAERLGSNGRPLLIEKPGATSLYDLRAIHELGAVRIGYTERHNPAVHLLESKLSRVGRIKHICARRLGYAKLRGGDPALDLATHDLDVLDFLGFNLTLDHVSRTEHHVSALLHQDDFTVSVEASHLHPIKVRELEVLGTQGALRLDYQAQTVGFSTHDRAEYWTESAPGEPLKREWQAFFNGEGSDGIAAMTIAEQMVDAPTLQVAA